MRLRRFTLILVSILTLVTSACRRDSGDKPVALSAFCAASVADAVTDIGGAFAKRTGHQVLVSRGSSGKLCEQIILGASCDLFLPADEQYLTKLQSAGRLVERSFTPLASNRLVIAVREAPLEPWPDVSPLLHDRLGNIAVANPDHAPAGQRAMEALAKSGLKDRLRPRLIFADDVRLCAQYAASGAVGAALIYETDAAAFADKLHIAYRFLPADHSPIRYLGAICSASPHPALAADFLAFADSPEARLIWRSHGFAPP